MVSLQETGCVFTRKRKTKQQIKEEKGVLYYIFKYLSSAMAVMVMVDANTLTAWSQGTRRHMTSPRGQFFSSSFTRVNGVQKMHMIMSLMARFMMNMLRTVRSLLLRTTAKGTGNILDSLSTKRKLQRELKRNITQISQPMTDGVWTLDWCSQLGNVGFEFALQITFGA